MKSFSDLLNNTPWWALLIAGMATAIALAAFVTPYHIIDYRNEGSTPEERKAIKREIDNTFAENAINVGRGVIRGMLERTSDPVRRAGSLVDPRMLSTTLRAMSIAFSANVLSISRLMALRSSGVEPSLR